MSSNWQNSVEFPTICRICNHATISSKLPFWFTEVVILKLKKSIFYQLQHFWSLKIQFLIKELYLHYFPHSKMAISEFKDGHFRIQKWPFWRKRAWLQILEWGSNSTISYLTFDTHDSPGAVFIWKREIYRPRLLVCLDKPFHNKHLKKLRQRYRHYSIK